MPKSALRHFRCGRDIANIDPSVEAHVAEQMGLEAEPVSTQVTRDRHAMFCLGVIASSIERLAVEVRHLQRTEVLEAEEYFSEGQKGSSAMPHKRNPVLTENLTGLARLVRGMALSAMENVALWHERDISHSSVERMIGPDATITFDFALARLTGVIENLVVYPTGCRLISTGWAGWCIHKVLWHRLRPVSAAKMPIAWCNAMPCRSGAAKGNFSTCSRPMQK